MRSDIINTLAKCDGYRPDYGCEHRHDNSKTGQAMESQIQNLGLVITVHKVMQHSDSLGSSPRKMMLVFQDTRYIIVGTQSQ